MSIKNIKSKLLKKLTYSKSKSSVSKLTTKKNNGSNDKKPYKKIFKLSFHNKSKHENNNSSETLFSDNSESETSTLNNSFSSFSLKTLNEPLTFSTDHQEKDVFDHDNSNYSVEDLSKIPRENTEINTNIPILEYFPSEILLQIAMSLDFKSIIRLSKTCKYYYKILNDPENWKDYWKYTSDCVECMNTLVTYISPGDEFVFGEVTENVINSNQSSTSLPNQSKPFEKKNENETLEKCPPKNIQILNNKKDKFIDIERVLFVDHFSTNHNQQFEYNGGIRLYIPKIYGNIITNFYDHPESVPCSLEHLDNITYNQNNKIIDGCAKCKTFNNNNLVYHRISCSGRPVSNISASWKQKISDKFVVCLEIMNSRSEYGFGFRNADAFIHSNSSFLINGNEMGEEEASLFRKLVTQEV